MQVAVGCGRRQLNVLGTEDKLWDYFFQEWLFGSVDLTPCPLSTREGNIKAK